jgi:hypothetical protein
LWLTEALSKFTEATRGKLPCSSYAVFIAIKMLSQVWEAVTLTAGGLMMTWLQVSPWISPF